MSNVSIIADKSKRLAEVTHEAEILQSIVENPNWKTDPQAQSVLASRYNGLMTECLGLTQSITALSGGVNPNRELQPAGFGTFGNKENAGSYNR
jgi:hypothetical protein